MSELAQMMKALFQPRERGWSDYLQTYGPVAATTIGSFLEGRGQREDALEDRRERARRDAYNWQQFWQGQRANQAMAQATMGRDFMGDRDQRASIGLTSTQMDPHVGLRSTKNLALARQLAEGMTPYRISPDMQASGGLNLGNVDLSTVLSPDAIGRSQEQFDLYRAEAAPNTQSLGGSPLVEQARQDRLGQIGRNENQIMGFLGGMANQTLVPDPFYQQALAQQQQPQQQQGRGFWRNLARVAAPIASIAIPGVGPIVGGALGAYGNSRPGEFGWGSLAKGAGTGYLGGALMGGAMPGTSWGEAFKPNFGKLGSMSAWRNTPAASMFGYKPQPAGNPLAIGGPQNPIQGMPLSNLQQPWQPPQHWWDWAGTPSWNSQVPPIQPPLSI